MTNSTVSRIAQINGAGAVDALLLKQFGGEILTEFAQATVFKERHFVRQISGGKSAQFPMIGSVTSSYHTPGNFIDGQTVNHAEKTITVDGLLVAPIFLDNVDEKMNHYDVRGPYATEMGRELARQYDRNVARMYIQAARGSSELTGRAGGSQITHADMPTDSSRIEAAIWTAAQTLDEKNVAPADRNAFFKPAYYYMLCQREKLLNKDYAGTARIDSGTIGTVAGITLIKTNEVPSTNLSADSSIHSKYRADYSKTVGIVGNRWAVGTVQLMDISLESEWEIRRQGTFFVAKLAVGTDTLDRRCSIEIADA
jgi:hypothetical protein